MIIHISKSVLFTQDPDKRFCDEYQLPKGLWRLMYNRYKLLGYSLAELHELFHVKTGKRTSAESIRRWVWRTDVYNIASPFISRGAESVVSEIFGEYEMDVIRELTKNLKHSVGKDVKSLP